MAITELNTKQNKQQQQNKDKIYKPIKERQQKLQMWPRQQSEKKESTGELNSMKRPGKIRIKIKITQYN